MLSQFNEFEDGTSNFQQLCIFFMNLQHTISTESVNISVVLYHGHLQIKQEAKLFGYLMMSMNVEHSETWDRVLAKWIHSADPKCQK